MSYLLIFGATLMITFGVEMQNLSALGRSNFNCVMLVAAVCILNKS